MITLKRGDTAVVFKDELAWSDGPQLDLTGCSVRFLMSDNNAKTVVGTATITNAMLREVEYAVGANDLDTAGMFKQEWEVTFPGSVTLTVPTNSHNTIRILEDLA